jgi:hypothetical protein
MRTAVALLACCVVVLGAYVVIGSFRPSLTYRPLLYVEENFERVSIDRFPDIFASCPRVGLASRAAPSDYQFYVRWRDDRWLGALSQGDSYIWTGKDRDSNKLLRAACTALKENEQGFKMPPRTTPETAVASRNVIFDDKKSLHFQHQLRRY